MLKNSFKAVIRWFQRATGLGRFQKGRFVSREFVEDSLQNMIFQIRERTQSNRDVHGHPFVPYSPAYADWKKSTHVDLTLTGGMLDNLSYKIKFNRAIIYFSSAIEEEKAQKLNYGSDEGYFILPSREFFGVTDPEIEFFIDSLSDVLHDKFKA